MREPRPLIPVVPLAFILPDPLFQPQQRASDTAVDILCAAVAEGRLTLTELDERVGAALSARTICELAALIADLSGPWTPVPASTSSGFRRPRRLAGRAALRNAGRSCSPWPAALCYPVSRARRQGHGGSVHVQNRIICASLTPPA